MTTRDTISPLSVDIMHATVGIIEDDPHFRSLVAAAFNDSDDFRVAGTFASTTEFLTGIPITMKQAQEYVPDLLVVDVLAFGGKSTVNEVTPDGITMTIFLRRSGLRFATLVITSLDLSAVKARFGDDLGSGWEFLQKNSGLSPKEILVAGRRSVASLQSV